MLVFVADDSRMISELTPLILAPVRPLHLCGIGKLQSGIWLLLV